MELTIQESSAQGTAMVTWLHQSLSSAMGEIASLKGQIAILEHRLAAASASKPEVAEAPQEQPEPNAP